VGYQLVFWREESGLALDARTTYAEVLHGRRVRGLLDLPADALLAALVDAFPGSVREPNSSGREWLHWRSEDAASTFEVEWLTQHSVAECRPLVPEVANRIIEIADGFDCPLFDPQTGKRFAAGAS
jgi:hypothetical protein